MADISKYLDEIQDAVYGEEVRGSIINALKAQNDETESTTATAEKAVEDITKIAESAEATAAEANATAKNASDTADKATQAAQAAQGTADEALERANAAASEAEETLKPQIEAAQAAADAAQASADAAQVSADAAQATADEALETANAAVEEATDTLKPMIEAAQASADAAQASADAAQETADEALAKAEAAAKEAEENLKPQIEAAQASADAAQATADQAVSAAAAAQTTANQGVSAAGNAQAAADEALSTANEAQRLAESNAVSLTTKVDDAYVDEDGCLWLVADGDDVVGPLGPFAGGGTGGGTGNNAILTVTNTSGWLATTIASGGSCPISFTWSSLEDGMETGSGTLTITVGGVTRSTRSINQGDVTVDIGEYLSTGSNSVKVKVSDVYGNSRTINFSISVVELSLSSSFDTSSPISGDVVFSYVPVGSVEKTVYFYVDGELYGTDTVTTSGRQQSYVIGGLSDGTHTLRVYFTAEINGLEVRSNELFYDIMIVSGGSTATLITSSFDLTEVEQYTTLNIPFYVYVPDSMTADEVLLSANGVVVNTLTNVDRTEQIWSYKANTAGTLTLTITCGDAEKTFTLTVTESDIKVEAETQDLELYLSSYGRSNSEADPSVWRDDEREIAAELTGFNFISDGWQLDEDGNTVLRVFGDARVSIPLKIFESDFRTTGKTIEVEFTTRDVRDYDAEILSCYSGDRGIRLTGQEALIRSEQSELSTRFKEDEHVRVSFVVEKAVENRLVCCYINGILSGVVQYPASDDFSQLTPVDISIGSEGCTIDVYCIRSYKNSLTRYQVLDNWIADTQDGFTMKERYEHNDIYDAYGQVTAAQLPNDLPYLVLVGESLPEYKGNKLTVDGYFTDPSNPARDFEFSGASIDVQGTSSAGYVRKNYKIKFAETHTMFDNAIPTKTFTLKADVASSEGANNVELVRLYNEADPYRTPPQQDDARIRQGIDGFPMVVFHDNGEDVTFIGKYNWNNDKGTEEVYGFEDGDQSWETLNNTSDRVIWKNADYSGDDWQNDFEARYPEDNLEVGDLAELAAWLVTTDQEAATGNSITSVTYDGTTYTKDTAAYRLAKFKAEFSKHLDEDSTIFYYLFTELFLLVDSRAKNTFPTMFLQDGKWCWLPYDMDTAIGINNEGSLVFDYGLEDTDHTETGADVYNGQQSVLWINVREAFGDEIQSMYQNLRSSGVLSYDVIEQAFEDHQAKWPEAIFNEDAYYKYIQPLEDDGDATYLPMCQGSKEEQRKWWLYNRFKYLDSKYNAGDASSDIITLRGYAKADITVIPYADIYAAVKYGSYLVQTRATRNVAYTLACPLSNVNDTEIYIYSCSQLADVGDLSGLKVGFADFSKATKLQAIKIGDGASSYSNANLAELNVGNSPLLETVDARNCPNLTQTVDLSGCSGIKEVYMEGTSIPAVMLPNGGLLELMHLPATITNLTIRNQTKLTDLELAGTSLITTLWLENIPDLIDIRSLIKSMASGSRIRIIGVEWEFDDPEDILEFYDVLDDRRGLDANGNTVDEAQISGTIYVDTLTGAQLLEMQTRQPNITIVYNHISSTVYFYNYDGSSLLYTATAIDGGDVTSPGSPARSSTAQYDFTFVGWSYSLDAETADANALTSVTADRTLYAAYSRAVRTYTVYFYNGNTLLQTVTDVPYGGSAEYTKDTPEYEGGDPESSPFIGWEPEPTNITGDTYCYAQFGGAFAVYSADDNSLTFYSDTIRPAVGDVYKEKTITEIYTDFVSTTWSSYTSCSWYSDRTKFTSVVIDSSFKSAKPVSLANWFYNFTNCKAFEGLENIDTSAVTTLYQAFYGCTGLTNVDGLAEWDTGAVTTLQRTFDGCTGLTNVDGLAEWDTSAVTSLSDTFYSCSGLTSLAGLSEWDVSAVKTLSTTFYGCSGLTSLDELSEWDVSAVSTLYGTFRGCSGLTSLDGLANWDVSSVTTLEETFYSYRGTSLDGIAKWDVSAVTTLQGTFYQCTGLTSLAGLSKWDVSAVTTLSKTFYGCSRLTSLEGIAGWNTGKVTNMQYTFCNCSKIEDGTGIKDWDTRAVKYMGDNSNTTDTYTGHQWYGMFSACTNLQVVDLSRWSTESLSATNFMFYNCSNLKTIYSNDSVFDVSNVTYSAAMFLSCSSLVGGNGTEYNKSNISKEMAHVDTEDNPGYFTAAS